MIRVASILGVLLALAWAAPGAWAQAQPRATLQVDPARFYVGDEITLQVRVDGATEAELPTLALPEGLRSEFRGSSPRRTRSIVTFNNRQRVDEVRQLLIQWGVTAERAGAFEIPPVTVTLASGERLTTQAVTVEAVEPAPWPQASLELAMDRTEVFVGQTVPLRLSWRFPTAASSRVTDFEFVGTLDDSLEVRIVEAQTAGRGRLYVVRAFGSRIPATVREVFEGSASYTEITIYGTVTARRAGTIDADGFAVTTVLSGTRSRPAQKYIVRAEPVELLVRDLPAIGRPEIFEGLVG
ncbi:MAG: BatD family protein, partial [Planctomycetota bacterium]